jgi:hypothetical protein
MTPILLLLQFSFFYSFCSLPSELSQMKQLHSHATNQKQVASCSRRLHFRKTYPTKHTKHTLPNILKTTFTQCRTRFPVYPTICLIERSTKVQHAYMHTHMHNSTCINTYTHTRQCNIHAYMHTHICIHTYMHTHIHIQRNSASHIHTYTR